jgi:MoxR-like ATPase
MSRTFEVIRRAEPAACLSAFDAQKVLRATHEEDAEHFEADDGLVVAVNAALAVGAPLLLTGDPGTGKTQVAFWVARQLGFRKDVENGCRFFQLNVQSTTTAAALLYDFDNVA